MNAGLVRRSQWLLASCLVLSGQVALAEVHLIFEPPADSTSGDVLWGVKQNGRLIAEGRLNLKDGARSATIRKLRGGSAELLAAVNLDAHESYFPSFGDFYVRKEFDVGSDVSTVRVAAGEWQRRTAPDASRVLTVHYHRFNGDYETVGLWTWDEGGSRHPDQQETFEVGRDDFGLLFQIDTSQYGQPGGRIGLLPRLNGDWSFKDNGDRFWDPKMGNDVFLVEANPQVFATIPDLSAKVMGARIDSAQRVVVDLTRKLPVDDFPAGRFVLRQLPNETVAITSVQPFGAEGRRADRFVLTAAQPLDYFGKRFSLAIEGFAETPVALGDVLLDAEVFFDAGAQLGATYTPEATTFRVFSPVADEVELVAGYEREGVDYATYPMRRDGHGIWSVTAPIDMAGRHYSYRLRGPGLDPNEEVIDIYATCTTGPGGRALIVNPESTSPPGFDPAAYVKLESPVDAVIYEMHVRDFTIAPSSGVAQKGKYMGLAECGTHLPGDAAIDTGLDHLLELGVTHVQLMPVQDFDNLETPDDSYNWGYMPLSFNSPEGWYASTPLGHARIRELKGLVQALHNRGIGVIMDVVYNHASVQSGFERLVPGYYFRRRPDGSLWNGSGCGNEFASEHPMARKFMLDSLTYWVTEYGIDGFRFDLMGLHDLETMRQIQRQLSAINPSILLYGEPWAAGACGLAKVTDKARIAGTGVGAFNDHFRDAIKGGRDGGPQGFIQAGLERQRIVQGLAGAIDDWAKSPTDAISYCECHDNLTTWDKLVQSMPDAPKDIKERMQRFSGLLVLTAQGVPFIHSGQEFCRSKQGSHNSYNLPDKINQIDWELKKQHREVFDYYRGLIALRKLHPEFRLRSAEDVHKWVTFPRDESLADKVIVYRIDATGLPGATNLLTLVIFNAEPTEQIVALPDGQWHLVVDADRAGTDTLATVKGSVTLPPHSGMVLLQ